MIMDRKKRSEVFDVKLKKDKYWSDHEDEVILSVTHNGWQWQGIALLPEEAARVIKVLSEHMEANT